MLVFGKAPTKMRPLWEKGIVELAATRQWWPADTVHAVRYSSAMGPCRGRHAVVIS